MRYVNNYNTIQIRSKGINESDQPNTAPYSMTSCHYATNPSVQKASMNLVQMTQLMDKFESQFEDLDVQISVMDQAMSSTSVQSTPEGEVNSLMQEVADEHGQC